MKNNTIQEKYNFLLENKLNKRDFMVEAKRQFPHLIRNAASFDEVIGGLKHNNLINEGSKSSKIEDKPIDFFKIFKQNITENKAVATKASKDVEEAQSKGWDMSDLDEIDNLFGEEFLKGFVLEMGEEKNKDKSIEDVKKIVAKNLKKDKLFYVKNGQFGIKGIGYETELPGLGTPKEPKGKHKSSGYGDLDRDTRKKINESLQPNKYSVSTNLAIHIVNGLDDFLETATDEQRKEVYNILDGIDSYEDLSPEQWDALFGYLGNNLGNEDFTDLHSLAGKNINEIGMFNDPIGYDKNRKSSLEKVWAVLEKEGKSEEEIKDFVSSHMFKSNSLEWDEVLDRYDSLNEGTMGTAGEEYVISKAGSKSNPHYVLEKPDGSAQIDMTFDSEAEAKKYASKKKLKLNEDHTSNPNDKYVVKYSKANGTWQVWEGDVLVTDFATEERAKADAKRRNDLQGLNEGNDFGGMGLIVKGRTSKDNDLIDQAVEESGFYGVYNSQEDYWFFPEEGDQSTIDRLENELETIFMKKGADVSYEVQFNENINGKNKTPKFKIGDILTKNGKKGKITKVMDDMVNVDFGGGDVYGITLSRIKGNEILKENINKPSCSCTKNKSMKKSKTSLISLLKETEYYMAHKTKDKKTKDKKETKPKAKDITKDIEKQGNIAALEAKIGALDNEINERQDKLTSIQELEDLKDFIAPSRIKEVEKEIKELERQKGKYLKKYESLTGEEYKSVVTDTGEMGDEEDEELI